jgi:hypothetical protein
VDKLTLSPEKKKKTLSGHERLTEMPVGWIIRVALPRKMGRNS